MLFGDYNPSGKLPITFYKSLSQLGDFEDYSMKGRTYRYMSDPLFPFGYGLSYTTFAIGEAKPSAQELHKDQRLELTIPVTNSGKRSGTEIVQVYLRKVGDDKGPLKSLKGFQRVEVQAGKTVQAVITLPYRSFETFDPQWGALKVQPGNYEVLYGTSSDSKDLQTLKLTIR